MSPIPPLVLARSSPYRRRLVERLGVECTTHSPDVDESVREDEYSRQTARRLAADKARAVADRRPDAAIHRLPLSRIWSLLLEAGWSG